MCYLLLGLGALIDQSALVPNVFFFFTSDITTQKDTEESIAQVPPPQTCETAETPSAGKSPILSQGHVKETLESALLALDSEK